MNSQKESLKELRDWHARVNGWIERWYRSNGSAERDEHWIKGDLECYHPFSVTLDAAKSAMPKRWTWRRYGTEGWRAFTTSGTLLQVTTPDTDDEIYDRYLLAKLCKLEDAKQELI